MRSAQKPCGLSTASAAPPAISEPAHVSSQPSTRDLGNGLLHGADAHAQHAVRALLCFARPRRIEHLNVTGHPTAEWVWRQGIEATPWGAEPRFLIRDRDRSYGGDFITRAKRIGIKTVLTPVRAPKANAIAERVIGTLRRECVDHIIPLNARHLRRVLLEYVASYNATRPHRTLELETPEGPRSVQLHGRVVSIPVLAGTHHRYEREAA